MIPIMRKRSPIRRRRRTLGEDQAAETAAAPAPARGKHQNERLGPQYDAGPVHELPTPISAQRSGPDGTEDRQTEAVRSLAGAEQGTAPAVVQEPMPTLEGEGEPEHVVAYNLRLQGRTDATFDGGSFHTQNVTVRPATDCTGCSGRPCIHVTGTLVATYSVSTTVTLPRVSDFPGLTPCQQRRVQDAIDNVLAPHEQEHVRAFETYNGTTRRAFDLTLCRSEFDSAIQRMFEAEESARRQAAQAASDALDPFHFDVDLDCEEPQARINSPHLSQPGMQMPEPPEEMPA